MNKLLADENFNLEDELNLFIHSKSKRKSSMNDGSSQYMHLVEYNKDLRPEDEAGFKRIEFDHRIQRLRQMRQKPQIQPIPVQPQQQVTYNYPQSKTKAAKIKRAMAVKAQTKVKFTNIGAVKSEWTEIKEILYSGADKKKIEYSLKVLSEAKKVPALNPALLQIKPKKPIDIKVHNENQFNPESFFDNAELNRLFNEEEIPEGHFAFFMQENTLLSLASIMRREFPFNVSIAKQGNKFAFISDYNDSNFFSVVKGAHENAQKPVSEKEDDVALYSIESTLVEENLALNFAKSSESQLRFVKLSFAEKYHIYTNVRLDCVNQQGNTLLVRSLLEHEKSWFNLENKFDEIFTNALLNNGARIWEWIFSAYLAEAKQISVGLISRLHPKEVDQHILLKTITKNPSEYMKLYNLNIGDILKYMLNILKEITLFEENGNYAFHKIAYKTSVKLFSVSKAAN